MEVQLVERKIMEPKELSEVQNAIEGVVDAIIHGGKDKWTLVMAELPKAIKAADGLEQVKVEAKTKEVYECVGAFVGRMTKSIVYKAEADPTPDLVSEARDVTLSVPTENTTAAD